MEEGRGFVYGSLFFSEAWRSLKDRLARFRKMILRDHRRFGVSQANYSCLLLQDGSFLNCRSVRPQFVKDGLNEFV